MPREDCKYGPACYRKNPSHFQEFSHPWLDKQVVMDSDESKKPSILDENATQEVIEEQNDSNDEVSASKRKRSDSASSTHSLSKSPKIVKIQSNPLNLYLTKVKRMDESVNNFCSIGIVEILSSKWGQLQESAQFNYMFEIEWLIDKYPPCFRHLPMLLVHQDKRETTAQLEAETAPYGNIDLAKARLNDAFGTHHTKMMLLRYEKHLRVVIHTANLIEQDWREKTQGVWLSPLFPLFKENEEPRDNSPTKFQTDLIIYLRSYKSKAVDHWCEILKKYDMSEAKVFIIGSTPGNLNLKPYFIIKQYHHSLFFALFQEDILALICINLVT